MFNKLRKILVVTLALLSLICLTAGLTACGGVKLTELTVEGYRFEFLVGDTFELGEGFTVYAHYSDNTKVDVTEEIDAENDIKFETGFDMNVADDYQITVNYQGKKAVYTIYVGTFDNVLLRFELDTQEVKTSYKLGESISYDNIKVSSTYENAQGEEITQTTSGLKGFTTSIRHDASSKACDGVFKDFGDYTVTVSKSGIRASYKINVEGVDITTVQGAAITGTFFKDKINAGTLIRQQKLALSNMVTDYNTTYKFGDNYTYVSEQLEQPGIYHISKDENGLFCLFYNEKSKKYEQPRATDAMIEGPKVLLFYNNVTEYGAANALTLMYDEALKATNKNLVETVDIENRTYTFKFSGLVLTGNNRPDYYENEVTFTLSENYAITYLKISQDEWENDQVFYENDHTYKPTFYIDAKTGITTPRQENGVAIRPSTRTVIEINQTEGERTATNPNKREDFVITSFDITYNGEVLQDGAVIDCDMKNPDFTLKLENVLPSADILDIDKVFLNYEGNFSGDAQFVDFEGFNAFTGDSVEAGIIKVTLKNGGVWTFVIKTENVTKKITFNVTGVNPERMDAKIRNEVAGTFYSSSGKLVSLNGFVHFYGEVDKYANPVQSAVITSDNASKAKIETVELDSVKCFKFTATEKGVYTVKVSSDVASNVSCEFTFEVGDVPDYINILKGKYSAKDREGNLLELAFTPAASEVEISGTFVYTETTKDGEVSTETYSYTVDTDKLAIQVTHVSGANLAVELSVDASGKLVLTDGYGMNYVLTAAE